MISLFRVIGQSMEPSLREGERVLVNRMSYLFSRPRIGHMVVVRNPEKPGMLLVKRIVREKTARYWLEGDNPTESRDSRHFGWVGKDLLLGKVIHKTGSLDTGIMTQCLVKAVRYVPFVRART